MRDVHPIRLRGPWQLEPLVRYVPAGGDRFEADSEDLPAATKAKMPADWSGSLGEDFLGQVRYTRRFHKPDGLEDLEEVWLVVEPPCSHATITLNGHHLGEARFSGPCVLVKSPDSHGPLKRASPGGRFDVTTLLKDANVLEILVTHPELDGTGCPIDDDFQRWPGGLIGEVWLEIGFPD